MNTVSDKHMRLVQRIGHATATGALQWQATAQDGVYQTTLGEFVVRILTRPSLDADDLDYYLQIFNSDGDQVMEFADADFAARPGGGTMKAFEILHETYATAQRQSVGDEALLNALLAAIPKD